MAMTVAELKPLLQGAAGGDFTITAAEIAVDPITTLFATYLPGSTLSLASAAGNPDALTVHGALTLGDGAALPTDVTFVADPTSTTVTGIAIAATLPGWKLNSPPALVFNVTSLGRFMQSPRLTLQAGGNDPDAAAPVATLGGTIIIQGRDGSHSCSAIAVIPLPDPDCSFNLAFDAALNLTLDDLGALAQLVTGANFDIIPPPIEVAPTIELSSIQLVADPVYDAILALRIDVGSTKGLTLVANVFEIPSFTFSFVVPFPGSGQAVSAAAAAQMNVYGEIIDVAALLPSPPFGQDPLYIQGALGHDTPLPLKPFVSNFLSASSIPDDFEMSALTFGIDLNAPGDWAFEIELANLWHIPLPGTTATLDLQRLLVQLRHAASSPEPDIQVNLRYAIGGTDLYLTAQEADAAWTFSGGTVGRQSIDLLSLLADLETQFGLDSASLPDSLTELDLQSVQLSFSTAGGADEFTFALDGALAVSDVTAAASLTADIKSSQGANPFAASFGGTVTIVTSSTNVVFDATIQRAGESTLLVGSLNSENTPLELQDLLHSLGFSAQIPPGMDISLTDLGLLYQAQTRAGTTTSAFIITAASTFGRALFVAERQSGPTPTTTYVFAADPALSGSLAQLPLIGGDIPKSLDLRLSGLQLFFTSRPLTADDVKGLNALLDDLAAHLPGDKWQLPGAGISSNLELDMALMLGDTPVPFTLPLDSSPAVPSPAARARVAPPADAPGAGTPGDAGSPPHWLSIQKSVGPLYFRRIGFAYANGSIECLLDASLAFSALAISLDGLSIASPLTSFQPTFGLQGFGVNLDTPAVQITGAFLSTTPNGLNDSTWEYAGEIVVSAEAFTISGIGAYGKFNGHPSVFLFVMLDAPLGGPSFFFVTGIAGGFGYNRAVNIPTLDQLPAFPLVAAAMSGETGNNPFAGRTNDPSAALEVLDQYLPMSVGENWVAAGVRFTSFELIQSFALLTVAFGTRFEVALLGLSAVTMPPLDPSPVAYAELAMEVTFAPDDGLLTVAAQLTPSSFVLDPACHLTGGFAFYMWFKDLPDGACAGDFVVSLGGYNPHFTAPAFYPTVPTLGANWQVSPNLSVKGGIYFALTPSCVMAGGYLTATWQGGNLRAWFNADANFLLSWKPFHYQADISVAMAASYRLDLGFVSQTFTLHAGASLVFWGPPFAGRAYVDLDVMSFTISFGPDNPSTAPITWLEFKQSFLPGDPGASSQAVSARAVGVAASAPTPTPTDTYCYAQVTSGLLVDLTQRKQSATDPDWVISPELFQITTHTVIPATQAVLVTGNNRQTVIGGTMPASFGVGPVGVADGKLRSTHTITICKVDGNTVDDDYDAAPVLSITPVTANVPRAPWSTAMSLDLVRSPNIGAVNSTPATIGGLVVGFQIQPNVQPSDSIPAPFDIAALQASPAVTQPSYSWAAPEIPTTDSFDQGTAYGTFMSSLTGASAARTAILAALVAQGMVVSSTVDVDALAASADQVLLHAPRLSYLGELSTAAS